MSTATFIDSDGVEKRVEFDPLWAAEVEKLKAAQCVLLTENADLRTQKHLANVALGDLQACQEENTALRTLLNKLLVAYTTVRHCDGMHLADVNKLALVVECRAALGQEGAQ